MAGSGINKALPRPRRPREESWRNQDDGKRQPRAASRRGFLCHSHPKSSLKALMQETAFGGEKNELS